MHRNLISNDQSGGLKTVRRFFQYSSHSFAEASLGIRQSPRGESDTDPTFGPSGRQLRLNCCEKKRRKKFFAALFISF